MDSSIYSGYQHSIPGFIVMGVDKRFVGIHIDVGGSPIEIEAMPGGTKRNNMFLKNNIFV